MEIFLIVVFSKYVLCDVLKSGTFFISKNEYVWFGSLLRYHCNSVLV